MSIDTLYSTRYALDTPHYILALCERAGVLGEDADGLEAYRRRETDSSEVSVTGRLKCAPLKQHVSSWGWTSGIGMAGERLMAVLGISARRPIYRALNHSEPPRRLCK